jgi:hypothetical protein
MKQVGIIALAIFGALALATSSCTYEELIKPKVEVPDSVSFGTNIIPIFNTSCNKSGCHSKGGIPPNLSEADAYTTLIFFGYVDPEIPVEDNKLYDEITNGSMKQYATDQDRALILSWIEQGALDN